MKVTSDIWSEQLLGVMCPSCNTRSWVNNGDTSDITGVDVQAVQCCKCGETVLIDDEMLEDEEPHITKGLQTRIQAVRGPGWHDRPTGPGTWVTVGTEALRGVVSADTYTQADLDRGAPFHCARVYGPIPEYRK